MDTLSDDLLLEIFSHLPHKAAVRFGSISKRLSMLISIHILRHILDQRRLVQQMVDEDHEREWRIHFLSRRKVLTLFLPTIHLSSNSLRQLGLGFLGPCFGPKNDDPTKRMLEYTRIVGFSNGLLLMRKSQRERLYYVCNPLTQDSVKVLPLPPFPNLPLGFQRNDRVLEGFVCEPYYQLEGENGVRILHRRRFRVVRFPLYAETSRDFFCGEAISEFEIVVFSSETGEWKTHLVSCRNGSSFAQPNASSPPPGVAHGGKIYFVGSDGVLVYDPFGDENRCDVIAFPIDSYRRNIAYTGHVGVSCGGVRLCALSFGTPQSMPNRSVSVWQLKSETNEWRLLHRTLLPTEEEGSVRHELPYAEVFGVGLRVRGFHPHHGDVVLFQNAHRLFYGNLKTREFRTAAYGIHGFYDLQVVSLDLPWWPTPIPSINYDSASVTLKRISY